MQCSTNHIGGGVGESPQHVKQLEAELETERRLVEGMEAKQRTLMARLEAVTKREAELREEANSLEKSLTILKHDLKEVSTLFSLHYSFVIVPFIHTSWFGGPSLTIGILCVQSQRRGDGENEARRKAESLLHDMKRKLDEETNKRTREMNNNQQASDKMSALEKQVAEMQEKVKAESEASSRLRKQAAELTVARAASEQMQVELKAMLLNLQSQRDSLQQEVAALQGQLSQERSERTQVSDLHHELEGEHHLIINKLLYFIVYMG